MLPGQEKRIKQYFVKKLKEKDFLISVLEDNKEYLATGTYRVSWTGKRKIYLKNKNTKQFLLRNRQQSNNSIVFQIKSFIDAVSAITSTISITNQKERMIKGEMVMMTYSSNVKIIDFSKKIILNKMAADPQTYKRVKEGYQSLKEHFRMTIFEFWDRERVYLENYLEFIPYNHWEALDIKNCINEIFDSYIHYFASINQETIVNISPFVLFEGIKESDYRNHEIVFVLEEWLKVSPQQISYPIVRGHGDMKFENILLTEKEFYFIDLEFSADYFFFYDLINFVFNEAMNKDYSYIRAFLQGAYDAKYKTLFEVFGLEYDGGKKLHYIAVYLIDRILNYDMKVTIHRLDLKDIFNKYLLIMDEIEELNKRYMVLND